MCISSIALLNVVPSASAAPTGASLPDPVGDVTDARGDITGVGVNYASDAVTVSMTVRAPEDATGENWQFGFTGAAWLIHTGFDPDPDYVAVFGDRFGWGNKVYPYRGMLPTDYTGTEPACSGDQIHPVAADGGYRTSFAPSCLGNPDGLRVSAYLLYSANDTGTFTIDIAPDVGAVGPVSRPAVSPDHPTPPLPPAKIDGYWSVDSAGLVRAYGAAPQLGNATVDPSRPIVGMASTPTKQGYWLVASDGGIFSFGDARFFGSTGAIVLNQPIVGMAATVTGNGYWLVASDGGIFSFGDAVFYGSTGNIVLNQPIVGMMSTPTGNGYWLIARDGGLFAFGDAAFFGSTGNITLNQPVVGGASTSDGGGYWLVAADGGVFAFGESPFFGSTGDIKLAQPIVGMTATSTGQGYRFVAADGGIFNYGDAGFVGALGTKPEHPVVGMAG